MAAVTPLLERQTELRVLRSAVDRAADGHGSTVVVSGEAGIGKTSLINCAIQGSFGDLDVLRGAFEERVTTEPQLRAFLSRLIGIDDASQLETCLAGRRRRAELLLTELCRSAAIRSTDRSLLAELARARIPISQEVRYSPARDDLSVARAPLEITT